MLIQRQFTRESQEQGPLRPFFTRTLTSLQQRHQQILPPEETACTLPTHLGEFLGIGVQSLYLTRQVTQPSKDRNHDSRHGIHKGSWNETLPMDQLPLATVFVKEFLFMCRGAERPS